MTRILIRNEPLIHRCMLFPNLSSRRDKEETLHFLISTLSKSWIKINVLSRQEVDKCFLIIVMIFQYKVYYEKRIVFIM